MNFIPRLITRTSDNELKIVWSDNKQTIFNLRNLRYACQCALCRHEITGKKIVKIDDIPESIDLKKVEVVGNYALHFSWSDGHSTGIYSYDYLRGLVKLSNE